SARKMQAVTPSPRRAMMKASEISPGFIGMPLWSGDYRSSTAAGVSSRFKRWGFVGHNSLIISAKALISSRRPLLQPRIYDETLFYPLDRYGTPITGEPTDRTAIGCAAGPISAPCCAIRLARFESPVARGTWL